MAAISVKYDFLFYSHFKNDLRKKLSVKCAKKKNQSNYELECKSGRAAQKAAL